MSTTENPPAEKIAYTAKEAAALLSISERTLWTLQNAGRIRSFKVGRAVRYTRAELLRFTQDATDSDE